MVLPSQPDVSNNQEAQQKNTIYIFNRFSSQISNNRAISSKKNMKALTVGVIRRKRGAVGSLEEIARYFHWRPRDWPWSVVAVTYYHSTGCFP
jgi:hypothetical protein